MRRGHACLERKHRDALRGGATSHEHVHGG